MPYRLNWERNGVYIKLYGAVDPEDLDKVYAAVQTDPRFNQVKHQICDFLDIEEIAYSEESMAKFGSLDKAESQSKPKIKVALVMRDNKAQALAGFYQAEMATTSWDAEIFHNVDDARMWVK